MNSRPEDVLLDERGLPVAIDELARDLAQAPPRRRRRSWLVIPLLVPSWLGFTMTGYRERTRASRGPSRAPGMPACRRPTRSRLARPLSRQIDSVAESLPVYGTPSSSHRLGTCASRLRPIMPSAMLKTTSTFDDDERAREIRRRLERHDDVPVALDGLRDRLDRLGRVVLGLAVVAAVRVDALHVEREADAEARPTGALRSGLGSRRVAA